MAGVIIAILILSGLIVVPCCIVSADPEDRKTFGNGGA